jgi:outer membrane receptor for ferric coprogen and ferric-rhodotorulic acid
LFGRSHELLLGTNYSHGETEQRTAQFTTPLNVPVNVYRWDPEQCAQTRDRRLHVARFHDDHLQGRLRADPLQNCSIR